MAVDIIQRILSNPLAIIFVVLFFGASVFVHELGHFLAARWRKLKIERFSIGFGPRLFGWKDKHGVDWRVSLLPLGGYVALPQLADMRGVEGDSKFEQDQLPPLSYADKMIVSVAGAFFNVLFALILGSILWVTGLPVNEQMQTTQVGYVAETMVDQNGYEQPGVAYMAGIRSGDRIKLIDGTPVRDWQDVIYAITTGSGRSPNGNPQTVFTVERADEQLDFTIFPMLDADEGIRKVGVGPANSLIVGDTFENSPAELAGLRNGDRIIAVNEQPVFFSGALSEVVNKAPDAPLQLTFLREGVESRVTLRPESVVIDTAGNASPMLGIRWQPVTEVVHINPITQVYQSMRVTVRVLWALIHPKSDIGLSNLSGPVGISYTLYIISQISILDVLSIVLLININLAILNLLPIPVLDGGHMLIATIAKLRGKPVPPNWVASLQGGFMLFFLGLIIYVSFFDVGRVGRNERQMIEVEEQAAQRVPLQFTGQRAQPDESNTPQQ